MIKKLRLRFIILSAISLLALLLVVIIGMNVLNYYAFLGETDELLDMLSRNGGEFPFADIGQNDRIPPHFSPETPYETRYFSAFISIEGKAVIDIRHTVSVNESEACEYVADVYSSDSERGFADRFRYHKTVNEHGMRITFLDCGRKLDALATFALYSVIMALVGYLLILAVIIAVSGRIVRPMAESYEKQRRFITDAGHEIRTPLAIINANADLALMELGEDENIGEIKRQTKALSELTDSLVYLSKMEESGTSLSFSELSLTDTVSSAATAFSNPFTAEGKTLKCNIEQGLTLSGNETVLRRMVFILLDNALKYSSAGTDTECTCSRQGKHIILSVANRTDNAISANDLTHIFDRFYRPDPSRNSQTGGHGIGLSVAKAIAQAHGGSIKAELCAPNIFVVTVTLPV